MGFDFGSIPNGTNLVAEPEPGGHGTGCRGCAATLLHRAGITDPEDGKLLLQVLGLIDSGPSRVRRLVDAGMTGRQILAAVPGATYADVDRARSIKKGGWTT